MVGTSGALALAAGFAGLLGAAALAWWATAGLVPGAMVGVAALVALGSLFVLYGVTVVQPNYAAVMVLFGRYVGTIRTDGLYWINPLTSVHRLSLRARNMGSDTIKVNDLDGNPIEIAVVTVWEVRDTAQACFDVDNLGSYVDVQIEAAVREIAKEHPYDEREGVDVVSLRADTSVVAGRLLEALQERLDRAGVHVLEARVTHLAYAPEIAGAMLQRQQASAIVAARRLIVDGAVGMVEQALADLSEREVVELNDSDRAHMVGNLLVVLCGQQAATPVVQTGR